MTAELQKNQQQQMSPRKLCSSMPNKQRRSMLILRRRRFRMPWSTSPQNPKSESWNAWFIFLVSLRCRLRWSQPHSKMNHFYLIIKKNISFKLLALYISSNNFFFFDVKLWLGSFTSVSSNSIPCKIWWMVSLSSLPL